MSTKWITGGFKKVSGDPRRISFIASHEKVDRDSEVIVVSGIDTSEFERHPTMLLHHDHTQGGVARVERLWRTTIDGAPALLGEAVFPDRPRSNDAWKDTQAGLLGAVSIGFKSLERGAPMLPGQRGPTYLKTSLLEISLVSLPACPTCLITSKASSPCRCHEDIGLEDIESPIAENGKAFPGCPRGRKCPTSENSHPDFCIITACPLKVANNVGGQKGDDVLEGCVFPSTELDIEDEAEHVFQSASTINKIIRQTLSEGVRHTVAEALRKELNYHRGRVD